MLRTGRAVMTAHSAMRPLVAVIGTTGVGKSQLAVSLAQSLKANTPPTPQNGLVLSADSMQLYRGLDVITNKVTEEEQGGIEHWGLDVVQPGEGGSWDLGKWCAEADKKVATLPESTLPIVCGGTHYFIQHFLFPPDELSFDRPAEQELARAADALAIRWTPSQPCPPVPDNLDPELKTLLDTFWTLEPVYPTSTSADATVTNTSGGPSIKTSRPVATDSHQLLSIWRLLEAVDPKEAARWHWKDGRKVRRGLERWWERGGGDVGETNVKPSGSNGRHARFRTVIFWVYEVKDTLRPRLDKRVDKMVENGLLEEIKQLRDVATATYGSPEGIDLSEGIFQSIGFKEFAGLPLPLENASAHPAFKPMLERMKLSTHQYAKSQIKWITKQLLPAAAEARALGGEVHVYAVPGGPSGELVARDVLSSFLSGSVMPDPSSVGHPDAAELLKQFINESPTAVPDTASRQLLNARRVCETCSKPGEPFSVLEKSWDEHLRSKVHKRSKFSQMTREEWIAAERAKGAARKLERETLRSMTQQPVQEGDQIRSKPDTEQPAT